MHEWTNDIDVSEIHRKLPKLKAKLKGVAIRLIYNADDCGLFYKLALDYFVINRDHSGAKNQESV